MITLPKGTKDVIPNESYKWHYIEEKIREITKVFCIKEVRTPTFEHTNLFLRGVGQTTDIVNKEMYTFNDKGNRSMTLKPEGTAGVARCVIEHSLAMQTLPLKMFYLTPVFRYERPQSGRLREHHQFGVEMYGADTALCDAEVISVAKSLFDSLGIENLELNINSIGCPECRAKYNKALKDYLESNLDNMCQLCRDRFDKNPLRILDCKNAECTKINENAPSIQDYLCEDCESHQSDLINYLNLLKIDFKINPRIVRGLDYYTKTVFEFVSKNIGAQGTVCGGGRYNNLVEEVGGKPCPAVGFGMGIERLIMVLEQLNLSLGEKDTPDLFIAQLGTATFCFDLATKLRKKGFKVELDLKQRGLKPQMKYANKLGAKKLVVIGESEIESNSVKLKNMLTGEEENIILDDIDKFLEV